MAHLYVQLAKKAVESYIKKGEIISPFNNLPKEFFKRKAGVFVTITTNYKLPTKNYTLRGCIGTYLPLRENIAEEIIHNAIAAVTEDYRFGPVREEELPDLSYAVYILSELKLIKDFKELDPQKYGIIIKTMPITGPTGIDVVFNGHFVAKTGLLLPDLDGVDTIEKQITICCQKGGIDPTKEKILIYRFTVEKYQ